ncbi:hypothetical protein E3T26_10740 [Cryobacterium sp. TMT1-21]|uniref:Cache domain-containing protein n=1 Tax=Cryobacterium shii TaxID=1259235 RepID=A0AAQ2C6J7_9MICO|nr:MULTISPECIES: PDC sensor domain-containing protein [Cryobacterium]TFC48220.1 hypothetical protein E3O49_07745 [Cryobacterium shii]TFC86254.1 hypothetical protein E3T24_06970 [Cryobacterium sp. TmT2-59]TFD12696.1 hypothetical protein E3T26_10740 [Cryobacterium sp. TMT1-21]TFD15428.1 hypothetical protein E3T42_10695 [Cryobacterium sp. TMT4-10]TFD16322.1 hypothetical protein E3T32_15465 [Cryobacterium sp. TMT2-23]
MPETSVPDLTDAAQLSLASCAAEVGEIFARAFRTLEGWRDAIVAAGPVRAAELDALVEALVVPALRAEPPAPGGVPESLLIGAGFIAAPQYVTGRDAHFAWWLGPLAGTPLLGTTSGPSRLDLAARVNTEFLRDFRELEWYQVPESTNHTHVTGPYVDHLCTFDYVITLTMPVRVDRDMVGVVGADVFVKSLEQVLLPHFLALASPVLLINEAGRVVVSTEPSLPAGDILPNPRHPLGDYDRMPCPGTPFLIATRTRNATI